MGFFKFVNNASRVVGVVTKPIAHAIEKTADQIKKIPVVGQVFDYATIGINLEAHMLNAAVSAAQGKRIDKTAITLFKKSAGEYKKLAHYTQSVVSFVPGVGTGVAGALAAGIALSDGKRLDKVVIEGIKGSIPGGALAQSAFSIAQGAVEGQPIDKIAINALPIPPQTKQALVTGLALTKDLAHGKKLDKALLARIDDATKLLTPELAKAVQIGSAVGIAKRMQDTIGKELSHPMAKAALSAVGKNIASADNLIDTARNMNKQHLPAFDLGTALMSGKKTNEHMLIAARNSLTGPQKKAFDSAVALQIGKVKHLNKKLNPAIARNVSAQVGYYMTHGLAGAEVYQKVGLMKEIAKGPIGRTGAASAIKEIADERKSGFWHAIKQFFGLV